MIDVIRHDPKWKITKFKEEVYERLATQRMQVAARLTRAKELRDEAIILPRFSSARELRLKDSFGLVDEAFDLERRIIVPHAYELRLIEGNLLLNEGITALQNLLIGAAETAFNNANSYLGVGDSSTAASAGQTGLQASTNKLYKAMETSYPTISSQTTTWRSVFGSSEANFAWNEFTVASGNSDAADNLNRKVSAEGTKASGQVWTLDLAVTWS